MDKAELAKIAANIGQRLAGPDNKINATLASTVGGSGLLGAATVLLSLPEPNAQILGGVLMAVGFFAAMFKEHKKTNYTKGPDDV